MKTRKVKAGHYRVAFPNGDEAIVGRIINGTDWFCHCPGWERDKITSTKKAAMKLVETELEKINGD